jgi:hypothetical protein
MGLRADRLDLVENAARQFDELKASRDPRHQSIVRRVLALKPILLADALHGDVVTPAKIPGTLISKHHIENLYVEDLSSYWRLLYTLTRESSERVIAVIEIVDHKQYDKWFPNRGR